MDFSIYYKILAPLIIVAVGVVLYKWNAWNQVFKESMSDRSKRTRERGIELADYCSEVAVKLKSELETKTSTLPIELNSLRTIKELSEVIWKKSYFCGPEVKITSQTLQSMVRLVENLVVNENTKFRDVDIKVMLCYFLIKIMDYAISTTTPRHPRYIGNRKQFKREISKYAYGEYLTLNDLVFHDMFFRSTSHVYISIYHGCILKIQEENHAFKKLFVEALDGKNGFLFIDMLMKKIAFPNKIELEDGAELIACHIESSEFLGSSEKIDDEKVTVYFSLSLASKTRPEKIEEKMNARLSHLKPTKIINYNESLDIFKVEIAAKRLRENFRTKNRLIRYFIFEDQGRSMMSFFWHEFLLLFKLPILSVTRFLRRQSEKLMEKSGL